MKNNCPKYLMHKGTGFQHRKANWVYFALLVCLLLPKIDTASGLILFQDSQPTLSYESKYRLYPLTPATSHGILRTAVIAVQFNDTKFSVPLETLEKRLNEMNEYFRSASYGAVSINWSIPTSLLTLNNSMSYYGKDLQEIGDDGGPENIGFRRLITDAVRSAYHDVNFAKYDFLIVVHAGNDQANYSRNKMSDEIWSRANWAYSIPTDDNVTITRSATLSEKSPLGMFAHEFAHLIGKLPDHYDSANRTINYVGAWSLMDAPGQWLPNETGDAPADLDAWSKIKLGWMRPVILNRTNLPTTVILTALGLPEGDRALVIPFARTGYYLVEVRQKNGIDKELPGEGVLIYRVNESKGIGQGPVRLVSAYPLGGFDRHGLDKAPFGFGEAGDPVFIDAKLDLGIVVLEDMGTSYRILVTNAAHAAEADAAYQAIISAGKVMDTIEIEAFEAKTSFSNARQAFRDGEFLRANKEASLSITQLQEAKVTALESRISTLQTRVNTLEQENRLLWFFLIIVILALGLMLILAYMGYRE